MSVDLARFALELDREGTSSDLVNNWIDVLMEPTNYLPRASLLRPLLLLGYAVYH